MPYFCPKCHRLIPTPSILKEGNLKVEGEIILSCGNCKGKLRIKPKAA